MIEVALVVDLEGKTLRWHLPPGRSGGYVPDSHDLWEFIWNNRDRIGGVAHTHPWNGTAGPSQTDVTTFAAIEEALGKRLVWPVVTFTDAGYFAWVGPNKLDYQRLSPPPWRVVDVDELRQKSR